MQRFSISVNDELAEWIESQAGQRGVSKAKVIRDALKTARLTGLVKTDEKYVAEAGNIIDRIEGLERRVSTLESEAVGTTQDSTERPGGLVSKFEAQLEDKPPTTEHGEEAVIRIFKLLLKNGPMKSAELRETLYPDFEDKFANAESMWQATNRHLTELDGIKKAGHGTWDADPGSL